MLDSRSQIKNLNELGGPETLEQGIRGIIGNHQTQDGDDATLFVAIFHRYNILEALQAVYKLNSLLVSSR
jgi:hypothetical protein